MVGLKPLNADTLHAALISWISLDFSFRDWRIVEPYLTPGTISYVKSHTPDIVQTWGKVTELRISNRRDINNRSAVNFRHLESQMVQGEVVSQ